ncbi:AmmeMemoRadiSam system protein A [Glycomyces terrestris]|uniref:AmmeMemoRadiSam system protein A n=1 Tax=Glycomyces terrestris TaxID=2493553 RepID=A0A426UZY6_9ACTN|nr:AmmeMemoRadiSam system protein A [Glycomyces terrestris]RRS00145.1 AmmeMemoRadiSam system protein A [Glycomyces terrestris]
MEPNLGPVLTALARSAVATSFGPRPPGAAELLADTPPALAEKAATFVTLEREHALRGCIGTLVALRPLGVDVVRNARLAARDPRLPPVEADEVPGLTVKVAVLTPAEPLAAQDFPALLDALRPGADGLTLKDGDGRRATFLPSVWAAQPDPERFVAALLRKGGWPRRSWAGDLRSAPWPKGLRAERYGTVEYVSAP